MINFDVTGKKHKRAPDHPDRILKNGGSGSGKTIAFFNPISRQADIDNIYAMNPYEVK